MSLEAVKAAVKGVEDGFLSRDFVAVWPLIEEILNGFAGATKIPIFTYLNDVQVYQSDLGTMPPFCKAMLRRDDLTAPMCSRDGARRASGDEPLVGDRTLLCHAGMLNGIRHIDTGVGRLTILFGSRTSNAPEARRRREQVMTNVAQNDAAFADELRQADAEPADSDDLKDSETALLEAIASIVEHLLAATVSNRALALNMTHELSLMLLGLGLVAMELDEVKDVSDPDELKAVARSLRQISAEARLGLYIVRNFLSHTSESHYQEVTRPQFRTVDVTAILLDMVDLYEAAAATKKVTFDVSGLKATPRIRGADMELRRLFHNLLSNAVKYSYHSAAGTARVVKIRSKMYDPGFRQERFSITIENYGLGLTQEETARASQPGFRGKQARAEVPAGAGIGLSEASKIVRLHGAELRIKSEPLHEDHEKQWTYLTTVELVFSTGRVG